MGGGGDNRWWWQTMDNPSFRPFFTITGCCGDGPALTVTGLCWPLLACDSPALAVAGPQAPASGVMVVVVVQVTWQDGMVVVADVICSLVK